MKTKLYRLLLALLGFAGFESCDGPDMYGCPPIPAPEYGCPSATFLFNATAHDQLSDEPIKQIRVSVLERGRYSYWDKETGTNQYKEYCDTLAQGYTNAEGNVLLLVQGTSLTTHEIAFDDIDGEQNGGDYASTNVVVTTQPEEFDTPDDSDGWDGAITHEVNVKLAKKIEN